MHRGQEEKKKIQVSSALNQKPWFDVRALIDKFEVNIISAR